MDRERKREEETGRDRQRDSESDRKGIGSDIKLRPQLLTSKPLKFLIFLPSVLVVLKKHKPLLRQVRPVLF